MIAAGGDQLFQLHNSGRIWRFTGALCAGESCPGWQMLDNNSATTAISAAGGQLYQLHNSGRIWRYTGTPCSGESCPGWQMLDNNPRTGMIAAGDQLYQLHADGLYQRHNSSQCGGTLARRATGISALAGRCSTTILRPSRSLRQGTNSTSCTTPAASGVPRVRPAPGRAARAGGCWTTIRLRP